MMAALHIERVKSVHHWTESLFSFTTTRDPGLRFENGQFLMIGLQVDGRPLMRAYSIASPNHEEHLEFFSIKVPNGPLTSRLQSVVPGQEILVSRKPTGTLVLRDLLPGRRLLLFSTGTGLAPFLSLVRDPQLYERFERIILVHGVRQRSDLAYEDYLSRILPQDEYLGDIVRGQLIYYPTVTREPFRNRGRLTDLVESGRLLADLREPPLDAAVDRAMICGSVQMLANVSALLDARGFAISPHIGEAGHYVIERAFVEK
jgi:ferredoxin/flavodoxin---NADP+ reductase